MITDEKYVHITILKSTFPVFNQFDEFSVQTMIFVDPAHSRHNGCSVFVHACVSVRPDFHVRAITFICMERFSNYLP